MSMRHTVNCGLPYVSVMMEPTVEVSEKSMRRSQIGERQTHMRTEHQRPQRESWF